MRLGFVLNRLRTLRSSYTSTHLAAAAVRAGLRTLLIDIDGFTLDPAGRVLARAALLPRAAGDPRTLTEMARGGELPPGVVDLEQLDGLLLRHNPVRRTVLDFARVLRERGVPVLNDPDGLATAAGKLYLECLPRALVPRTLVSTDPAAMAAFLDELGGEAVLKPVRGFGGRGVDRIEREGERGLRRVLRRAGRPPGGYWVLQELIPGAERGDKRILLVDGEPVGCYVRMRKPGEFRHNLHVGGRAAPAALDERDREIARALRPALVRDGIFLAGLDVIGGRAVEVNVAAPGGVANIERTSGEPVAERIIARLRARLETSTRDEVGGATPASRTGRLEPSAARESAALAPDPQR